MLIKSKLDEEVEVPDQLCEKNNLIKKSQADADFLALMNDDSGESNSTQAVRDYQRG